MKEEEAQKLISNKRSQPSSPSHPHTGTGFRTRSKHHGFSSQSLNKRLRRTKAIDSVDTDNWSSVLVKDIRNRRVFSPIPVAVESGLCVDKEGIKRTVKESDNGISHDAQNLASVKPADFPAAKEDVRYSCKEKIMEDGINIFNGVASEGNCEILNEECVKGTPPDAEIFGYRFPENGGSKVELVSKKTGIASQEPSIGSLTKRGSEKEIGNNSTTKSVHRPWSLLKVFKTPGSISYRRLLPYLMDMVKDDSCVSKNTNCPDVEGPGILTDHYQRDNFLDSQAGDSETLPHDIQFPVNGSSCASDLNLTSLELVGSEKDGCTSFNKPDSVDDDCCSKPLAKEGNGKIEIGASSTVHASHFDEPVDSEEIKRTDAGNSCNAEDVKDRRQSFSSIMERHRLNESDEVGRHSDHTTASETVDLEATDMMHPSEAVGLNQTAPSVFDTEGISRTCHAGKEVDHKGGALEKSDGSNEESIQLTPLDTAIFGKPEAYNNVENRVKCVSKSSDPVFGRPLDETTLRNNCYAGDNKMDSISKRKLGLSPCSQLKLFKTPSSFSYRRLLPYLMDIAKESCGAIGNVHCTKLEKRSEEQPLSLPSPLSTSDCNETPTEKPDGKCHLVEHDGEPSHNVQMAKLTASNHPYNNGQPFLTSAEHDFETPVSLGSPENKITADVISDKDTQLEGVLDIVPSIHGSSSPTMPLCFVSEYSLNSVAPKLTVVNEGGCMASVFKLTNCAEPVEGGSSSQNSSQLEASNPLGIPPYSSKRSILKRNPRGCRGRCECLNCASFRLHAERAFEFSKNQMQDAEEVAYDLINKLSQLRTILEKSAFGSDDHRVVCTNQVKEACRKASEAEELAKSRLEEMNYDLNIHSRITCGERPRVRFANGVGERASHRLMFQSKPN